MKKIFFLLFVLNVGLQAKLFAQSDEAQQLLLNVEKLAQFKQILSDMKKGYQIVVTGYSTIKNLSQGNFNLHKTFLDALMEVSPAVRKYKKVADIINYQILIVKEYKNAFSRFKKDNNFNPEEIDYLGKVYSNLFKHSVNNLDELTIVITANKLRMSDDERLAAIDRIYNDMQDKLMFLRHFNNNTTILAVQRAREKNDAVTMKKIYGITN
ncbi:MAG: TerB family tellurite resistance protein [Bacteroidota bacterium]|nr:TerB family tellurite resistance protein [Bacteroidota bacterium]